MDDDALVKGDLDSDHLVYTDKDIQEELGRMDGFVDMSKNRSRYSESFLTLNNIYYCEMLLLNGKQKPK